MFASDSLDVSVPLPVAQRRVLTFLATGDPAGVALAAIGAGAALLAADRAAALPEDVSVHTIAAYPRDSALVVPMRWLARVPRGPATPILDANLEMSAHPGGTSLMIIGSYRLPLQQPGLPLDAVAVSPAVRVTIRHFLTELAQAAAR